MRLWSENLSHKNVIKHEKGYPLNFLDNPKHPLKRIRPKTPRTPPPFFQLTSRILKEGYGPILLGQVGRLEAVLVLESLVNDRRRLLDLLTGTPSPRGAPRILSFGGQEKSEHKEKGENSFSPAHQHQQH